jgi:hypothetical protein
MSSLVPASFYVLLGILSKSFKKNNTPMSRHDGGNIEIFEDGRLEREENSA